MIDSNLLIYQTADGEIRLDVQLEDETVWLSQAQMAELFNKGRSTITEHISNVFKEGELIEEEVCRNFRLTTQHGAIAGKTQSNEVKFYNLDVIISVGYRVKSVQGTRFRIWATRQLREFITKGFLLNDERFKTGESMTYFSQLQERIRAIRLSERFFYQKIKDIYTTSIDYDPGSPATIAFFAQVQNKLLWAISQQTAAELVYRRSDANKPLMGMLAFEKKGVVPNRKDAAIAKNYLQEDEIKLLGLLVEQYLAFAETMAQQKIPMTMQDWVARLDSIIQLNGRDLLTHAGKISQEIAQEKMAIEYEKFKQAQRLSQREDSLKELEQDLKRLSLLKP
jgi:hypothetical protein